MFSGLRQPKRTVTMQDSIILAELRKLEDETQAGISINFIALYKRLGQLDFCTLEEFRQMMDQLLHEHGELCDASDGESGEEPLCLTSKGRAMAQSQWETTRTCDSESGS